MSGKSLRLHASMLCGVSISVVCKCIGIWDNAYSRKNSKVRNELTTDHISSKPLPNVWNLSSEADLECDNWREQDCFIGHIQLRPHCGRN